MDADLTPERLEEFIRVAEPTWVHIELEKYKAFRQAFSPDSEWAHRPPSMSPIIPLVYWASQQPYQPTNEEPMGYWYGEPKSILGRLVAKIMEFREYWESLPNHMGVRNIRWFLRTPGRFASFEHEIRTASVYENHTPYQVEPRFFDPRSESGEPDIIMRKDGKRFNVQCKAMDPSSSSTMSFELFQYLIGCLGRISQDFDVHSYLTLVLKEHASISLARRDIDPIIKQVCRLLRSGLSVVGPLPFRGGEFTFRHSPSRKSLPLHLSHQFTMWTGGSLFRERRVLSSGRSRKLATVCQVSGGKFPSFESYVYPRLEEAAIKAPKTDPLIISLHLYPPLPVHIYRQDRTVQEKVLPDLTEFFNRNRNVCLVLVSSNAQEVLPMGGNKQTIATPAWEVESQHWSGERPDYHPSAMSYWS